MENDIYTDRIKANTSFYEHNSLMRHSTKSYLERGREIVMKGKEICIQASFSFIVALFLLSTYYDGKSQPMTEDLFVAQSNP